MVIRPPSDAVVALRSMGRRWRGLFAGLGEDERPDDLAHRVGSDGHAALDHLTAATRGLTFLGRALEQTLIEEDPVLHPAVADAGEREWGAAAGSLEEALVELDHVAEALAHRAERVTASEWGRQARVARSDATTSALAVLWDAVDSAVAHLRAAERTLREVRGRPA